MILETLGRADSLAALHPHFAACFAFLRTLPDDLPQGRYDIAGDDAFALVQGYTTVPETVKRFETHRDYIDIHYVASGSERILHSPTEQLGVIIPYSDQRDVTLFVDPVAATSLVMHPGTFAILFPSDGHKPGLTAMEPVSVRKVVIKVRSQPPA
jgi:YhcH/YjgK/YiaL family protein